MEFGVLNACYQGDQDRGGWYAEYDDYSQYIDDEKPVDNYLSYTRLGKRFSIMKQKFRSTISFGKYVLLDIVITMVVLGILAGVVVLIVRVETWESNTAEVKSWSLFLLWIGRLMDKFNRILVEH